MTVSYTAEVATCKGFGCFLKLLFRSQKNCWEMHCSCVIVTFLATHALGYMFSPFYASWKASIYKLVWPDLFLFLGVYFSLSCFYRFFLNREQQIIFEQISRYCEKHGQLIPVSFVLGFYVTLVVGRWWNQYCGIPWPDNLAVLISAYLHGQDDKARLMRRTIMRYCCLALTQCFTLISPRVKKRFPTMDHLVESGLLLENERIILEELNKNRHSQAWLPVIWSTSIVTRARREGKIREDHGVKAILDEMNKFRGNCGLLLSYDWISVPLVYTQVVTLSVYTYFLSCVMGRQWLFPDKLLCPDDKDCPAADIDLGFPVFTVLQFFFYMGWLKVAEQLLNPFGDDDDDFEMNWLVDRNLQVSYLIVDGMHHDHPELVKDQYWDEVFPQELPYTVAAEQYREEMPQHSTAKIHVSKDGAEIISPPSVKSINQMSDSSELGNRLKLDRIKDNRRERTTSMRSAGSQTTLTESISDRLSRAASITSVFRRMFSRDKDRERDLHSPGAYEGSMNFDGSSVNVYRNVAEDVIPEVDENLSTIMSMKSCEKKPTAQEVFSTENVPKWDSSKGDTLAQRVSEQPSGDENGRRSFNLQRPTSRPLPIHASSIFSRDNLLSSSPPHVASAPSTFTSTIPRTSVNTGDTFPSTENVQSTDGKGDAKEDSNYASWKKRHSPRYLRTYSPTMERRPPEILTEAEVHLLPDVQEDEEK